MNPILARIEANPNPRRSILSRFHSWAWGLNREAAWDSARNVCAYVGVSSMVAYMTTMSPWWMPFSIIVLTGAWYADYLRHF